jgi:hypothetical protein
MAMGCAGQERSLTKPPGEALDSVHADGAGLSPMTSPGPITMPGPAPRGRDAESALALNQNCADCHAEIAREWAGSFHALSQNDPAYQRAFALEPLPFCQGCHAPETDPFAPVPEAAAAVGVGCVTCHVVGEHVLAAPKTEFSRPAPHGLTRAPEFASALACGGCHEFAFPDQVVRGGVELMQSTLQEHAASPEREQSCASCHMPSVGEGAGRHKSHVFAGGHDEALVKGALQVSAERRSDTEVTLLLRPDRVGHAFPTGDLFRRLEVSAEVTGTEYQVLSSSQRYLTRHFKEVRKMSTLLRSVSHDDRPRGEPLEVTLQLGQAAVGAPISWRVAYQRVEHPRSESEHDVVLDGEIELAAGTVSANQVPENPNAKGKHEHVQSPL